MENAFRLAIWAQGKTALTSLATFASCLFIHSERFCDYSIVWTAQFLMASQQKLLNADRLQTVLFSTRFVTWERENQFAILNVNWISFSTWSTDNKKNLYSTIQFFFLFLNVYKYQLIMVRNRWKARNKKAMCNTLFETWFDSFHREERSRYDTFLWHILNVTKPH